jgi:hypothetical protein
LSSCNFVKCIIEQTRVTSSSLDISALKNSIKIYFIFFRLLFHFICVLELCHNIWKIKSKRKKKNPPFGPRPRGLGLAQLKKWPTCWRGGAHAGRACGAVTAPGSCVRRRSGVFADAAAVASRRQGFLLEHEGGDGASAGQGVRGGGSPSYLGVDATVGGSGATTFLHSGDAPVVARLSGVVLQLKGRIGR